MESELATELTQRWNGPFSLRLLLQPTMAILFALRDGRQDAASGAAPYLHRVAFNASERRSTIASAWSSLCKVLVIALILDSAFQYATDGSIRFIQSGAMAMLLCALPYTLLRGPAARYFSR